MVLLKLESTGKYTSLNRCREVNIYVNYLYPRPAKLDGGFCGGGYTGFTLSVRPSVRPSICL